MSFVTEPLSSARVKKAWTCTSTSRMAPYKKKLSCLCPCLEGIQPNTTCDFIVWCLVKHRDNLTFFGSYCILGESCCVLLAGTLLTAVKCLVKEVLMLMSLTPDVIFVHFILSVDNYVACLENTLHNEELHDV